jgi:hypothetical protein
MLATKGLSVASQQHTVSHILFHQGISDPKQHDCHPPLTLLALLGPLRIFSISPIEDETVRPLF